MRKITLTFAVLAIMAVALPASAYTLNGDGTGFVGKGEVQLALGLNNNGVQNGTFAFALNQTVVTEVSWTCTNTRNENVQERERTTTTTTTGVVSHTERVRNQVTGFRLTGFAGAPTEDVVTEGNQLNSCPTNWVLTPAGDPEVISSSGGLSVNGVPLP